MKKILISALTLVLIAAASCKNKSGDAGTAKKENTAPKTGGEDFAATLEKKVEELGKLNPKTREEMTALVPETFMGGQKGMVSGGTAMGVVQSSANYSVNDSIQVYIGISDAAGSAGAGNFSNVMNNLHGQLGQSGDETIEAVTIGSVAGFKKYTASESRTELWFLGAGRYLVTVGGNAPAADMIKAAASLRFPQ